MSIVVIGVGGLGRGACNWLKQRLEHEYGSVANAGVKLLVMDGPREDDQYLLPDGFQIDTSISSPEFYGLSQLPGAAIKAIAQKKPYAYIDRWLTSSEASHIAKPDAIIPETGYGQTRPAGRVGFFLEVSDIRPLLAQATTGQNFVLLVGSQSGGTGSGMLLDVAQMIRALKPANCPFHAYVGLSKGFSATFSDAQEKMQANTRGFAGLRELQRLYLQPSPVEYAAGISVDNGTLFDGCYLVDGSGGLSDVAPVYGVAPAIADHILCMYLSPIAGDHAANWAQQAILQQDGVPAEPGYWSLGVHSYLYDWRSIEDYFSLRFATETYDAMLTVPAVAKNTGENMADQVLASTGPGNLAVQLSAMHGLAIAWPEENQPQSLAGLQNLRTNLTVTNGEGTPGPKPPYATVLDWVELTKFLRKVANDDVINQCREFTKFHLGLPDATPNPNPDSPLWGWLNYQRNVVCREFVVQLCVALQSLFHDPQQNNWRSLKTMPYSLVIARDLLQACREKLEAELEYIKTTLARFGDEKILSRADARREEAEKQLRDEPPNAGVQRDYVDGVAQWCHLLAEWQALALAYQATLTDMVELTNDLWTKIGAPAAGWIGYLTDECRDQVARGANAVLTARQKAAEKVRCRSYVPQPGGLAEAHLYQSVVISNNYVDQLLSQLRWRFDSSIAQPGVAFAPTVSAAEIAASFDCYLDRPQVQNYNPTVALVTGLYSGLDGSYRQVIKTRHDPGLFLQYGRNQMGPQLSARDIWDVLAMEAAEGQMQPQVYGKGVSNRLLQASEPAISLSPAANPVVDTFDVGVHNAGSPISVQVSQDLANAGAATAGVAAGSSFRYAVAVARTSRRFTLADWDDFEGTKSDYFALRSQLPVHCFPEERNATDYVESYLLNNHVATQNELPLHHSLCRHLADWGTFQSFAVSYVLMGSGLVTSPLLDSGGGPGVRSLSIPGIQTSGGQQVSLDLGLGCNMDGVLRVLLDPQASLAKEARGLLNQFARSIAQQAQADVNLKQALKATLEMASADQISLPGLAPNNQPPEDLYRPHLALAIWAACWQFSRDVLG